MRAEPPLANAFTCSNVAMVVSPGNVVSRAPCAHPSFNASAGVSPVSKLAKLGVARVSYGPIPFAEAMGALQKKADKALS